MKSFFLNQNNDLIIEIFSLEHFLLILLTLLFSLLLIINKQKFINLNYKGKRKLQLILAFILFINFILRRGTFIYYNVYDWHYHLDINFCNFTSILYFVYFIFDNKKIYKICYYMTFVGPLLAILLPSVNITPLNYSFYSFLILHHFIFIVNIVFIYVENIKFNNNEFYHIVVFIAIYFFGIYIFNIFFDTKYNIATGFINNNIINSRFMKLLLYNNTTTFVSYCCVNLILLFLAKILLRKLNK